MAGTSQYTKQRRPPLFWLYDLGCTSDYTVNRAVPANETIASASFPALAAAVSGRLAAAHLAEGGTDPSVPGPPGAQDGVVESSPFGVE